MLRCLQIVPQIPDDDSEDDKPRPRKSRTVKSKRLSLTPRPSIAEFIDNGSCTGASAARTDGWRALPSRSSSDDDDADFGRPPRAKKRRRNGGKRRPSTDDSDDMQAYRISARSGKATNYNEDDLFGDLSDLDDDLPAPQYEGADGPGTSLASVARALTDRGIAVGPVIDVVLDHRPEATSSARYLPLAAARSVEGLVSAGHQPFEFLVKWQNLSHRHASWLTLEDARSYGSTPRRCLGTLASPR